MRGGKISIMQKRNQSRLQIGETLLEFFTRNVENDKSVTNIISVLSILNGYILNHPGSKSSEIFDFGNYFIANGYEALTRKDRKKAFGEKEALILNLYYEIAEKIERQEILEMIEDLSPKERYEAMTLTNAIFNINENKIVTLSTEDGPIEFHYDKKYKSNEIEALKQELFNYMAYAIILGSAGLIVRIKRKSARDDIFGITIQDGKWRPLKVYELMESTPGNLDFGVRYTELSMKK